MSGPNKSDPDGKVEIFQLANKLKERLGSQFKDQEEGFLPPESIEEAEKIIARLCINCPRDIGLNLENLSAAWEKMKAMQDSKKRSDLATEVFTFSHEIKDLGAMCGFDLIAHFAESLRDYIAMTQLSMTAQVVIIQAHLDAMQIVHRKGYKKDAGPEAEELKKMVKMAIDKYH